jgi:hypothetical protein
LLAYQCILDFHLNSNFSPEILKILLQHGGDPNVPDNCNGSTPLHMAAKLGTYICSSSFSSSILNYTVLSKIWFNLMHVIRDFIQNVYLNVYNWNLKWTFRYLIFELTAQINRYKRPYDQFFEQSWHGSTRPSFGRGEVEETNWYSKSSLCTNSSIPFW